MRRDVDLDVTLIDVRGILSLTTMVIMRGTLTKCLDECPSSVVVDLTACSVASPITLTLFPAVAGRQFGHPVVRVVLVDSQQRLASRSAVAALGEVAAYRDLAAALAAVAADRSGVSRVREGFRRSVVAPGQARDVVGAACSRWGIEHLARSAQLVVSELVTNAVIHAGTDIGLEVMLRGDFLLVRVRDGSATPPVEGTPQGADGSTVELIDHGRGLPIVRGLSSGWGFLVNDKGDGKVVWASLRLVPPRRDRTPGYRSPPTLR